MTREELIDGLYDVKNWHCNGDERLHTLVTEAIKALEQEPKTGHCPEFKREEQKK